LPNYLYLRLFQLSLSDGQESGKRASPEGIPMESSGFLRKRQEGKVAAAFPSSPLGRGRGQGGTWGFLPMRIKAYESICRLRSFTSFRACPECNEGMTMLKSSKSLPLSVAKGRLNLWNSPVRRSRLRGVARYEAKQSAKQTLRVDFSLLDSLCQGVWDAQMTREIP